MAKKISESSRKKPKAKKSSAKPISKTKVEPKIKKKQEQSKSLNVVGIGASAGGLEAINAFFDKVPERSGLTFVLVQHLSPDYKSMMPELLAKHTKIKIAKVTNNMAVEPDCIYTIPADKNILIRGGRLLLEDRGNPKALNLPINNFLKSLAEDQKERAIGVILSGTGSDGTLGIESIKENGGMVIAQDPSSAAFDNMPKSAIATGLVDFILHPTRMPDAIVKYVKHPYVKQLDPVDLDDGEKGDELHQILTLLHHKTRLDFRLYKKATVIRRIERRMSIRNIISKDLYFKYLKTDPEEIELLGNDILIGVTGFFRDSKAFDLLDKEVLYQLVKDLPKERDIRLWIVGCSTGQEVYSLAMLLKEQFRKQRKNTAIKIFATDIDQRAIDKASKGIYSETILEEVPKALLTKYFIKIDDTYHVRKELRQLVIFARHDISKDPPFNNIDLACCRNLLIYIEPQLQEKILSFIHFSLNENGYLFLGSSETPGVLSTAFDEVSKKYKIYKNCSATRIIDIHRLNPFERSKKPLLEPTKKSGIPRILTEAKIVANFKDALLEDMIPPTVFINDNQDVVHVAGEIDRYVRLPRKQLTLNLLKMVDEQLYVGVSNAISKVKTQKRRFITPVIEFNNGKESFLRIIAKPYTEPTTKNTYMIISFSEVTQSPAISRLEGKLSKLQMTKEKDSHIRRLEEDLKETKEYLQSTIEELETSNEELQATNEELMAANEELQSSNEELQSVNEELYTVNNEFENKLSEMTELNDDLNNFLQSTHIATLFLDNDLNIKRFTDAISHLIKVNKNDIGRYVGDFSNAFKDFNIMQIAQSVLENFQPIEQEVATQKGEVYLMRTLPYVTSKKEVKGVVFVFVDVNELKKIELQLKMKAEELGRSNKELEQFAYLASHDLKAPVTNLDSLAGVLESEKYVIPEGMEVFTKLKSNIGRLRKTISILNEVIAAKKNLDIKPEKVELDNVVKGVLQSIEEQVRISNAKVTTDFTECRNVYFPQVHLHNILQNLVTNAIKYSRKGQKPIINISSVKDNGTTCVQVKDNGRGIDMKNFGNKLFGLFQRFHLDVEGKGIGLHITKSIIEKYGGRIEVSSVEGEGSTFKIYLKSKEVAIA